MGTKIGTSFSLISIISLVELKYFLYGIFCTVFFFWFSRRFPAELIPDLMGDGLLEVSCTIQKTNQISNSEGNQCVLSFPKDPLNYTNEVKAY